MLHPHQSLTRRGECAKDQKPLVAILSCADSRVPPGVIFDQGLGDLFVTRVAGNVINPHIIGSFEYAIHHLGTKLILVLGHKRCGAVNVAIQGGHFEGHVNCLIESLAPSVENCRGQDGDLVDNAGRDNVLRMVELLKVSTPVLQPKTDDGSIKIAGGFYDLDSGAVEWLIGD